MRRRCSIGRAVALGVLALGPGGAPAARADVTPECGPHEHLVVEKDPDEGGTIKRCVCDPGWDADGPAPPCRAVKGGGKQGPKGPPAQSGGGAGPSASPSAPPSAPKKDGGRKK